MQHPYLYFSKNDIVRFKEKMEQCADLKERYNKAIEDAESCLSENFITEEEANGRNSVSQHADFGSLNQQVNRLNSVLGTKYAVDGDTRCAEKLKKMLLHYISFEKWFADSYTKRTPVPWHSDICSTSTTLALASVFDIIHDYLTPEERRTIADGILEKGVFAALGDWAFPETRIHAVDSMGHNWWSVCVAEPATAFLALQDYVTEEKRQYVFDCADNALAAYLTYKGNNLFNKFGNFDDRGFFYESVNYNNYGTGTLLRYLWCNERYFGKNETIRNAIPQNLCDGLMTFSYPCTRDGKLFYEFLNFGDHSPGATIGLLAKYCVLTGIDTSAVRACAETYSNELWDEIGDHYKPEKLSGSVDYLPKDAVYSSGYAVVRSSWEKDATLLAVKSGFCWNHSHNDSGTFVIFHKGRPFFIDSGTCNYDSPLYHAYYCQDSAHSVLRVGGKGRRDEELYRGTKFRGEISDTYFRNNLAFIQADSTGPMAHLCSRMFRNFLWIDNRILVIFDEIYSHKEENIQLTLHFDAEHSFKDNTVIFKNDVSCAKFISHVPCETVFSEKAGHNDHEENEDKTYIELSTVEKLRSNFLISTLEMDYDEHNTEYAVLNGKNSSGIRICADGKETEIWFNHMADGHIMHDNSNNIIAGFDTDAYMLVITHDSNKDTENVLMICGSYLRRDEKTYISSFIKKTQEIAIV